MFNHLEQLRKKPLYYRKRIAVVAASVITVIIFLIWLSTFNFGIVESIDPKAVAEELKPLQQIKESVIDFYFSVKEMSSDLFRVATSSTR